MLTAGKIKLFNTPLRTLMEEQIGPYQCPKGVFGVEIELEGSNFPRKIPGWQVHEEHSLRGEAVEYVTDGPVDREVLKVLLDTLHTYFKAAKTRPNTDSYRAGLHIHYNVNERTPASIVKSIIHYTLFEPIFLKVCGEHRDGNLFCLSSYDTGDLAVWLNRFFGDQHKARAFRATSFKRGKYSALNTDPVPRFGSLEIRAFPTTVDTVRILRYTDLVDRLLRDQPSNPKDFIADAMNNPQKVLEEIFAGEDIPSNCESLLYYGAEQAWELNEIYTKWMGE